MNKMTKILTMVAMMLFVVTSANAQGFLKRLKERAINAAENAVERKVENKVERETDDAMDDVLDGKKSDKSSKKSRNDDVDLEDVDEVAPAKQKKQAKGEEVKSDFVPGSVVIFEDNLQGEQLGEFPSKWDLLDNNAEVASMNGKMAIKFEHGSDTKITPLLKDGNKNYLPEVYTLEFDYFVTGNEDNTSHYRLHMKNGNDDDVIYVWFNKDRIGWTVYKPNNGDYVQGDASTESVIELNDWNHFALSFNKRALKVYINGKRYINIPNAAAANWFSLETEFWEDHVDYITNVRLAKGGVDLYERNAQDMTAVEKAITETGKFVTNNILFATGKADLLPESMEEIQKVADYMKKNPSVRFEVQGHTDNQGSDKVNDPLSQQRAEAVVKALAGLGVDDFNLKAVGKGSHEPVADNKTEAGRAQNRRVVFVKR